MLIYTPENEKLINGECPCCGSTEVQGDGVHIEGEVAQQEVACPSCGAGWMLTFTMANIQKLED